MRSEDVLTAVGCGLWRWDNAARTVTLDADAARLFALPQVPGTGGTVTVAHALVRAHIHVVDFVEFQSIVSLALAEGTPAEAILRIVAPDGKGLLRTVRVRLRPLERGEGWQDAPPGDDEDASFVVVGLVSDVPGPSTTVPYGGRRPPERPIARGVPQTQTSVTGDWRRNREAFLLDAGRALAEARSTAEVLRVTSELAMPGFTPDGLAVFGVEGERLSVIGHHGQEPGAEEPFLDMPLETDYPAAHVVRTGRAVYLPTPEDYRRSFPAAWPLAASFGRQSWAFLPLVDGGRTIGAWLAAFAHPVAFTPDERAVLTTVARMLGQALVRARLRESEEELAEDLRRTMRPAERIAVDGLRLAARYVPTGGGLQVGGDWYDVIPLPAGRTALVIGDVQGHDVRAAGLMSQLRIALRAYAAEGHHPDAVLSRASRFLGRLGEAGPRGEERFATCLYAEVDPAAGVLDVARAGHPNPAVRMADGTTFVRPVAGGLPLGVDPGPDYPVTRLELQDGETLLLCTDGLLETGGHDTDSGWERVRDVLAGQPADQLEKLADALVQAVHGPSSHHHRGPLADRREDDIALLLVALGGPPRPTVRRAGGLTGAHRRILLTVAQAEPQRVADVRHQIRDVLHDWAEEEQVDGAELMVSELLTNVLVHTDGDALLLAELGGEPRHRVLRVEVSDGSDELPHRRTPGDLASSGRGVLLLEMLAHAWGVEPRGAGKSIWFELHEDAPAPAVA